MAGKNTAVFGIYPSYLGDGGRYSGTARRWVSKYGYIGDVSRERGDQGFCPRQGDESA